VKEIKKTGALAIVIIIDRYINNCTINDLIWKITLLYYVYSSVYQLSLSYREWLELKWK